MRSDRWEKALTVREVIEKLQKMDPNKKVAADGCDCTNPVIDVVVEDWSDEMMVCFSVES